MDAAAVVLQLPASVVPILLCLGVLLLRLLPLLWLCCGCCKRLRECTEVAEVDVGKGSGARQPLLA